jgi:radical SAM protein with 4Fe4S-binding SPASM domain
MEKYHDQYFPKGSQSVPAILKNTDLLIEWLYEKELRPSLEIFAGDSLNDPTCRKVVHKLLDAALQGKVVARDIILPTNMGWLNFDHKVKDVDVLLEKSEFAGIPLYVSASVDGKYMEKNRSWKSKKVGYSDEFYEKMFAFLAKHTNSGVHPMVYSDHIEDAIENFHWWMDMMEKYNLDWTRLYYLEVRNAEWSPEQTVEYAKFIKYLCHSTFAMLGKDKDRWVDFLFKRHGFNILGMPFGRTGRGMPCSIQTCVTLRLGDLTVIPCHRTAYKHMETAIMRVEDDKIVGWDTKNVEMWFAIQAVNETTYPYCEKCEINSLCKGGCLGAQYEVSGNFLAPIPTVCRLFHVKIAALAEAMTDMGVYVDVCNVIGKKYTLAMDKIKKHMMEDK